MKLTDLDFLDSATAAQRVLKTRYNQQLNLESISLSKAYKMHERVQSMLESQQNLSESSRRENNSEYMKLVLINKILESHIQEAGLPLDPNNPQMKMVMDKLNRGAPLTPAEQKIANKIAQMQAESKETVKEGTEVSTAQVVLAAKDMADRVQKMLEDVSEMQFKDLPAIVDSARSELGTEQAEQFQSQATVALQDLLIAMQTAKQGIDGAQAALTGDGMSVPVDSAADELGGEDTLDPDADFAADLEDNTDEMPELEPEVEVDDEEVAVGRAER